MTTDERGPGAGSVRSGPDKDDAAVADAGETVFDTEVAGSTREQIALFSAATEDPNPIHVDDAFAKRCGFREVIQQGPMTTAHFARLLAAAFGAARVRSLDLSFSAPVYPLESLRLRATTSDTAEGSPRRLALTASKADGTVTARGTAEIEGA